MKTILFDLDGTLTDSGEGVINCAKLALQTLGVPVPDDKAMRSFVGPPLRDSFIRAGVKPEDAEKAIEIYRSRYVPIGIFENVPYPGIRAILGALKEAGHYLCVATSKPEEMAVTVLKKFGLADYFDLICGATMDASRATKDAVIGYLLEKVPNQTDIIMVGDTEYDVLGAAQFQIPTIGVSWGYGTVERMVAAGASAIVHTPGELLEMLNQ